MGLKWPCPMLFGPAGDRWEPGKVRAASFLYNKKGLIEWGISLGRTCVGL